MTIKSSGSLSFKNDIVSEYADVAPHSLSEFYGVDGPVPTSGEISFSDFYGTSDIIALSLPSNQNVLQLNLYDYAVANGWNGSSKVELIIPNTVWVWSDDVTQPGLLVEGFTTDVFIRNYGKIIGRGGDGASGRGNALPNGQNGGDAIAITSSNNVYVENFADAYIAGGGGGGGRGSLGGGGGGAGGGQGGPNEYNSNTWTSGGAIGQAGSNGVSGKNGTAGLGGGAGGGSGQGKDNKGDDGSGSGGGGGRILPGIGGGGARFGGSANAVGENGDGSRRGGGGGGWGAAGGWGSNTSELGGFGGWAVRSNDANLFVSGTGTFYGVVI